MVHIGVIVLEWFLGLEVCRDEQSIGQSIWHFKGLGSLSLSLCHFARVSKDWRHVSNSFFRCSRILGTQNPDKAIILSFADVANQFDGVGCRDLTWSFGSSIGSSKAFCTESFQSSSKDRVVGIGISWSSPSSVSSFLSLSCEDRFQSGRSTAAGVGIGTRVDSASDCDGSPYVGGVIVDVFHDRIEDRDECPVFYP